MRILVTGNMGYIGPCVVEHLRDSRPEAELIGLDTGFFAQCLTGTTLLPERRLDCQYFGDVRAVPGGARPGRRRVVHLAGVSNDPIGTSFEAATLDVNHRATARSPARERSRCQQLRVRIELQRLRPGRGRARGRSSPRRAPYGLRDLEAPGRARPGRLADEAFTVTSLRFATACGMSDRLRLDLVLNDFVAGAHRFREITLLSDGTPWRPLIHVRDMARAIDWALERQPTTAEPSSPQRRLRRVELPDPAARRRGRLRSSLAVEVSVVRMRLRMRAPTR